jgi:hypothetical protein
MRIRIWVATALITSGLWATWLAPANASLEALFAPSKDLWPRWTTHDERSRQVVDHSAFDRLLGRYLSLDSTGVARFAYGRVTPDDRAALRGYLNALAAIRVSGLSRQEQLAFWINLYNALTIDIVLAHYPVRSILDIDISPGLFARGPWDKSLIQVEGEALTLNDIEHRILRPIWNDPRIHYAVNCASVSCPNLQNRAFTGATVERMLDSAARAYINNRRGARIEGGQLIVSKIYDWYQEDFGGSERGVIAHLRSYAEPTLAAALVGARIDHYAYDWSLNDIEDR